MISDRMEAMITQSMDAASAVEVAAKETTSATCSEDRYLPDMLPAGFDRLLFGIKP
jgi:hypothetical protein